MLDTNIFDRVVKGRLLESDLPVGRYAATHVQRDELAATADADLRLILMRKFENLAPQEVATETFVLDVSRLNGAKLSHGVKFSAMLARLVELDVSAGKARGQSSNQARDILIAETAIGLGYVLLTYDKNLQKVTTEFGGLAVDP